MVHAWRIITRRNYSYLVKPTARRELNTGILSVQNATNFQNKTVRNALATPYVQAPHGRVRTREFLTEGCCMGMFSAALCQGFEHCSKFEMFLSNLKIVISNVFKPGFFVKIYCPLVAVEHGKPDFFETQFLGFFQESIL